MSGVIGGGGGIPVVGVFRGGGGGITGEGGSKLGVLREGGFKVSFKASLGFSVDSEMVEIDRCVGLLGNEGFVCGKGVLFTCLFKLNSTNFVGMSPCV